MQNAWSFDITIDDKDGKNKDGKKKDCKKKDGW